MSDLLGDMRRTHSCCELGAKDIGNEVVLMGWVLRRRDHGGVIFVDLRDRNGITQVVFNPAVDKAVHAKAHSIRNEYVLAVRGKVDPRPKGMVNPNLLTGEIEVLGLELEVLNKAEARLGDRFDVKAFHTEVLKDGAMPLSMLEEKIDRWVEMQL